MEKKKVRNYFIILSAFVLVMIAAAFTIQVYPGGYGYDYNERSNELVIEQGMFFKEYKTVQMGAEEGLRYALFQDRTDLAIQTWSYLLLIPVFSMFFLKRVLSAYKGRAEKRFTITDYLNVFALVVAFALIVILLMMLNGHLQYLSQVFNSVQ
ncbi:hypothetical protein [Jeotgalibacillus campisalis]|uniref:Uncharacterized protein n=1 Tax=Jeotgalibacillus campisalis TaxID=220754 RepID=A0A0C2VWA8_9BACL|nr:hypothetical protein [Jeotgalibacillus campisalis]KIL48696.1 hypothetical protein KR50_12810 [Jeotgalibacillus campisalis]